MRWMFQKTNEETFFWFISKTDMKYSLHCAVMEYDWSAVVWGVCEIILLGKLGCLPLDLCGLNIFKSQCGMWTVPKHRVAHGKQEVLRWAGLLLYDVTNYELMTGTADIKASLSLHHNKGHCNNEKKWKDFTWGTFTVFLHQSDKQETVVTLLAEPVIFHWRDNPRYHAGLGDREQRGHKKTTYDSNSLFAI